MSETRRVTWSNIGRDYGTHTGRARARHAQPSTDAGRGTDPLDPLLALDHGAADRAPAAPAPDDGGAADRRAARAVRVQLRHGGLRRPVVRAGRARGRTGRPGRRAGAVAGVLRGHRLRAGPRAPRPRSAAGQDDVEAVGAQHVDDDLAMVALKLDHAVLDRAADAAALLQPAGQRTQPGVVERDAGDRRHRLAAAPGHLAPDLGPAAGGSRGRRRIARLAAVAAVAGPDEIRHRQRTPIRSTTKTSVSSGPMTPPAPRLP